MTYFAEIANASTRDARLALISEWHDMREAGCCDEGGPFCEQSRAWADGYMCAIAAAEAAGLRIPEPVE